MQFTINPFTHRLDAFEQDLPGSSDIETITGNVGGAIHPEPITHDIGFTGAGAVTITGTAAAHSLSVTVAGGGIVWTREANAAVAMGIDHGYINTNAGLTTLTLPAAAVVGSIIEICGEGAGGWTIAQNAGQIIQVGAIATTVGVGGSLSSINRYDCIRLLCRVTNTTWSVLSGYGVYNIV